MPERPGVSSRHAFADHHSVEPQCEQTHLVGIYSPYSLMRSEPCVIPMKAFIWGCRYCEVEATCTALIRLSC